MTRPTPEPVNTSRLVELALSVIASDRFPQLATVDGDQPRVRPVSPVKTDQFTVYVANLRSYHKTAEIAANPRVELCYVDEGHNQVRITGVAEVVSDQLLLTDIWNANPLLRQFLGNPDNPELIVYRIAPTHVRYMREWSLEYHNVPLELFKRQLSPASS
jgi:general stress protein 26